MNHLVQIKPLHKNFIAQYNEETKEFDSPVWEFPAYATKGSAGIDFRAAIDEKIALWPGETKKISAGIAVHINDPNIALFLLPRSGLGCNDRIVLANQVGLLDNTSKTKEIVMCMTNMNSEGVFWIEPGMRIAQGVFIRVEQVTFLPVSELTAV